jgi:quercetin dioxygenase-like cupin family protein
MRVNGILHATYHLQREGAKALVSHHEPIKYTEHYKKNRVFVRAVESSRYTLTEQQREMRASVPRLLRPTLGAGTSENWNILQPGDEPFRSQSLHVHFVTLGPGQRNEGHGHQNEAFFYILEGGRGFEMHDGVRYDWEVGDAVAVHNDSVHWHNNAETDRRAVAIVMKAKPTWLFLGLWQQGQLGTAPDPSDKRWGPRTEWAVARAPEDVALPKVVKPGDTPWEWTAHGHIRWLAADHVPFRIKATDAYLQEIPAGSRSGKRWQMGDQVIYVIEGEGYDLHWDVEVEISDQYYAHIETEPTQWHWRAGDVIWVPQNTVFQHFNTGTTPVKLLVGSNRLFKKLGYQRVVDFELAPEFAAQHRLQIQTDDGRALLQEGALA